MPSPIDTQFNNALTHYTSGNGTSPGIVDAQEARELIEMGRDINHENSWFWGLWQGSEGTEGLAKLHEREGDKFSPYANALVDTWTNRDRELEPLLAKQYETFTSDGDDTPGVIDRREAMRLVGTAMNINHAVSPSNWAEGTTALKTLYKHTSGAFTPDAKKTMALFTEKLESENIVSSFKTAKKTWHCHWFPMKESKPGGDRINNLYAPGGVLDKYDKVFGTKSREYELANNFRSYDSDASDADWSGHCNNASEVAAMLDRPKRSVTYRGVTFSPNDIAGLLVKVSGSLRGKVDFAGNRYNHNGDVKTDPTPEVFLNQVIKAWGTDSDNPIPFVLDIDREEQVWNYPYDQGTITESFAPPEDFRFRSVDVIPEDGQITFYKAELKGSTFDDQARSYQFWIHRAEDGSVTKSGWIQGEDAKVNPDFAWRPHPVGDLSNKENWVTRPRGQSNPHVNAADVFEIYSRSL